eukprot:2818449-Prymnesium_polylepis.1
MHTPHSPTAPDGRATRRDCGRLATRDALDATTLGGAYADGAFAAAAALAAARVLSRGLAP